MISKHFANIKQLFNVFAKKKKKKSSPRKTIKVQRGMTVV